VPDTVRKVSCFSIQVADKPGAAIKVLSTLVSGGINLLACSGVTRGRRAEITVVPEQTQRFNTVVRKAGLDFHSDKTGFLIQGEDRPGALAKHLQKLAAAGINVAGVDAVSAGKARWAAILWLDPADLAGAGRRLRAK